MAKWDNLNGIIENAIKSNNAQSITGNSLQSVLKSIVSDVGANATFAGIAIASTSPGSYDGPVFYIAASAGTYSGFGSIVVNAGELAVLYNAANGNGWNKSSIGISSIVDKSITKAKLASDVPIDAMQNKITQLETAVNTVVGEGATEAIENFAEILAFLNGITDTTTLEGLLTNLRAEINGELSNKVDKVSGKGLSTNDYTTAEKNKLAGIAAGANNYTHPSYTTRTGVPTADAVPGFGGTFQVSQPVSDAYGHITAVNARTITIPNSAATASAAGLMAAADKSKLDGIAAGAQVNTITGVKGNAESSYRTGDVNLTPANIGAAASSHIHAAGDITSGTLSIDRIADGSITKEKLADGVLGDSDIFSQINSNGLWLCAGFHSKTVYGISGENEIIVSTSSMPIIGVNVYKIFAIDVLPDFSATPFSQATHNVIIGIGGFTGSIRTDIHSSLAGTTIIVIATREANSSMWKLIFNNA